MREIWKTVRGFEDYEISSIGRVKSFKRYKGGKILKPQKNTHGYLQVRLFTNGKNRWKRIHRLILENFDPRENMNKLQANHIDGNKENNIYPENLEWVTPSENLKHAFKIGLQSNKGKNNPNYGKHPSEETIKKISEKAKDKYKGENNPSSILTEKNIIEIWKHINEGILTQKEIAEKFGVGHQTISDIKRGRTWKHIK